MKDKQNPSNYLIGKYPFLSEFSKNLLLEAIKDYRITEEPMIDHLVKARITSRDLIKKEIETYLKHQVSVARQSV